MCASGIGTGPTGDDAESLLGAVFQQRRSDEWLSLHSSIRAFIGSIPAGVFGVSYRLPLGLGSRFVTSAAGSLLTAL